MADEQPHRHIPERAEAHELDVILLIPVEGSVAVLLRVNTGGRYPVGLQPA